MSPEERSLLNSIAAHHSWAKTPDRTARTEAARKVQADRFEKLVPADITDPETRAKAAENLRTAHYKRMGLLSGQKRRAKVARRSGGA